MEHFNIIQALCRSAMTNPNNAFLHQLNRLIGALEKDGSKKESSSLSKLLDVSEREQDMAPSRIKKSYVNLRGEELTRQTLLPVDKESSSSIVEVFFPEELPENMPLFNENVRLAVESLMLEWKEYGKLIDADAHPASTCLIFGAPGTGKTHLAKWIAGQIGFPVVLAKLDGLMSSFLGSTSRNIGNLFTFASRYNCILLLDEFDAIAKIRNDSQEVGEIKRVVNTLLQNLDGRKKIGFTIGVTNHELLLDPAIWRRFEVQIEIPKPSSEVLSSLIGKLLVPLKFEESEIKFLSWCIEGSSGADAEMLTKWLKKIHVLNPGSNLLDQIRTFAVLNSGRINAYKRNLLTLSNEDLITALLKNEIYIFKQKDIAHLFNVTQSSISKQLSKTK